MYLSWDLLEELRPAVPSSLSGREVGGRRRCRRAAPLLPCPSRRPPPPSAAPVIGVGSSRAGETSCGGSSLDAASRDHAVYAGDREPRIPPHLVSGLRLIFRPICGPIRCCRLVGLEGSNTRPWARNVQALGPSRRSPRSGEVGDLLPSGSLRCIVRALPSTSSRLPSELTAFACPGSSPAHAPDETKTSGTPSVEVV